MAGKQTSQFVCPLCKKSFSALKNLNRHMKIHDPAKKVKCRFCTYETERTDNVKRHYEQYHADTTDSFGRKRKIVERDLEADSHVPGPSGFNQPINRSLATSNQADDLSSLNQQPHQKEMKKQQPQPSANEKTDLITPAREVGAQGQTTLTSEDTDGNDKQQQQSTTTIYGGNNNFNGQQQQQQQKQQQTTVDNTMPVPSHEHEAETELPTEVLNPALPLEDEELTDSQQRVEDGIAALEQQNRHHIQNYRRVSRRIQDRYNFELTTANPEQIRSFLLSILRDQGHPFKLNSAFGFILVNTITDQPIYYYPRRNNRLLDSPVLIRNEQDIEVFMRQFEATDIMEHCRQQRPNTKFIVRRVTNILFYVDKLLSFDIGWGLDLPDFVRNRRCIIGLNKDQAGEHYQDHYCLFRCYYYHVTSNRMPPFREIKRLVDSYCQGFGKCAEGFPGIKLKDLVYFEQHFQVNANVYQLSQYEDEETGEMKVKTSSVRKSLGTFPETINLNLYRSHFSYITDMKLYATTWECRKCRKLFDHKGHHDRHERTCNTETEYVFPGGGYGLRKTIFELLGEHGLLVDREKTFFPHRVSFDFEALSIPIEDDRGKKEQLLREQEPASVSVSSNVPGFTEPRCFISTGDPQAMVAEMYAYITEISAESYEILAEGFQDVLSELADKVQEFNELTQQGNELKRADDPEEAQSYYDKAYPLKIYKQLQSQLEQWLSRIPVLGFNSSRYDLNLIRRFLFSHFVESNMKSPKILKKGNDYLSVTTDHAVFLDIRNYVAANTSYSAWLRANDIIEGKGFFPYEWFTSLELLNQTHLPPIGAFWSELRQKNISVEDYEHLQQVWQQEGFQTMRDLLVWYNNKDVVPFLEAAEKMFQLWKSLDIDCFKSAISLPGLAMSYLVNEMSPNTILPLCDEKTKDIYETIRSNVTGGLSIVINRHQERNVTYLPNGAKTGWVFSHDANALYLWALGKPTGTGIFATWRNPNGTGTSIEWKRPDKHAGLDSPKERDRWANGVEKNLDIMFHREKAYPGSRTELEWLEWTSYDTGIGIEHRFNGRQKTVFVTRDIKYPLDGYDPASNTAYQFHGCYWHGHGCALDSEIKESARTARQNRTSEVTNGIKQQGFNVIELYECEWNRAKRQNPQIFQFLDENLNLKMRKNHLTGFGILKAIKDGDLFGLVECDIEVPHWNSELLDYFQDFPPICKNVELSRDDLGAKMKVYAEERGYMPRPTRNLINSFWARKILLTTPIIQWYLEHGLMITRIYQVIEMVPKACFANIRDSIADHRRRADADPNYKSAGESWKTIGNSTYGKSMTRKENQKDTVIATDEEASRLINDKRFHKLEEIGDVAYEVCQSKSKIHQDLPISIAFFVYNYAKMRMLEFVYDFLKHYLKPGSYQLVGSDTDSIIAGYQSGDIDELVKEELRDDYHRKGKTSYLATDNYSNRTPGLFKVERTGVGVIALCSKTYIHWNEPDDVKISSKGLSKVTNNFTKQDFFDVLNTRIKGTGTNYGFKVVKDRLVQYKQGREGLAYLYAKREVLDDGVTTRALYL